MSILVLKLINKKLIKGLAVALGNLYHPEKIEIPSKLVAGTFAAAHLLNVEVLKQAAIEKMSRSITKKTLGDCYKTGLKVKINSNFIV